MAKGGVLQSGDYVHLHNHTQYSLLDGLTKIPPMLDHAKENGMDAMAITDHGTLSGAIDFYKESHKRGIKPIIGIETYVAPRKHTDKDPTKDKRYSHLIILAANNAGYKNLMHLSTIANLEGFYYKPRVDWQLLEKYNEGLIVLSGCIGGEIGEFLRQDQYQQAKQTAEWYKSVFGDRYYLEVQDHGHPKHPKAWDEQVKVTDKTIQLAKELSIECVVTCDAHYLKKEDQQAHEILLCVQTGSYLSDKNRMSLQDFDLHVTKPKEVIERWGADHPDFIRNTKVIADRCNVELELGKILIPKFPLPKGETEKTHMQKLVYQGLAWRYGGVSESKSKKLKPTQAAKLLPETVRKRAEYELGVIDSMGFNGYFLIIADFINAGKDKGIVFGPGRGSAAGSIIAYSLKITELDPLKYDLLFERFLNPDRISMPDIDVDIQDSRRNEVIEYCIDKYGADKVANIVTFGRMAARNAVRDVSRVLQVPYVEADRLAKMIPPPLQGRHIPLAKSVKENQELKHEYQNNEDAKKVFDLAIQLEGTIRSHGVHAAGVVIAPDNIVKFTPLEMAQKGVVATQYSMGPIEDLGLLKMDFLGLSNLTIIKNTLRIIKKVYGRDININDLPLDDKKTYELLSKGDTTGVFQFESSGMKRYLKELKPTVFEDIVAMGALYRPGPLGAGLTDSFVKRKNGLEAVEYDHPSMKKALEATYGVLVYQEQVMQISREVCGFSGGQADTLRKAIGKKIREVMQKMEKEFIDGGVNHGGVPRPVMERFWKHLLGFADYCFNKSHSACYGLISYQTAYLKAHYPAAFMAALMTSDYDDTDRLSIEINECQHMNIDVLPPDVNESFVEFAVVPSTGQVRFGMAAVKNVGAGAVEEIIKAREAGGQFKSIEDFLTRVSTKVANRKTLDSLIKAGAFDNLGDRSVLVHNLDALLAFASRIHRDAASGQTDLFGSSKQDEIKISKIKFDTAHEPFPLREQLQWERELLGLYLSQHPLTPYETFLTEKTVPIAALSKDHEGRKVKVGGIVNNTREITTKNGQKMAFVSISDMQDDIELILFPGAYQQTIGIWEKDNVVMAQGKVSAKDRNGNPNGELKVLVDDAREVTFEQVQAYQPSGKPMKAPKPTRGKATSLSSGAETQPTTTKKLYLRLKDSQDQQMLVSIKQVIDDHPGDTEVLLVLGSDESKQVIKLPAGTKEGEPVVSKLVSALGSTNVKLQ